MRRFQKKTKKLFQQKPCQSLNISFLITPPTKMTTNKNQPWLFCQILLHFFWRFKHFGGHKISHFFGGLRLGTSSVVSSFNPPPHWFRNPVTHQLAERQFILSFLQGFKKHPRWLFSRISESSTVAPRIIGDESEMNILEIHWDKNSTKDVTNTTNSRFHFPRLHPGLGVDARDMIPLMEEVLHHLGGIKPGTVKNWMHYQSTGAGYLPSTVWFGIYSYWDTLQTKNLEPKDIQDGCRWWISIFHSFSIHPFFHHVHFFGSNFQAVVDCWLFVVGALVGVVRPYVCCIASKPPWLWKAPLHMARSHQDLLLFCSHNGWVEWWLQGTGSMDPGRMVYVTKWVLDFDPKHI